MLWVLCFKAFQQEKATMRRAPITYVTQIITILVITMCMSSTFSFARDGGGHRDLVVVLRQEAIHLKAIHQEVTPAEVFLLKLVPIRVQFIPTTYIKSFLWCTERF